jgi:hypothetical protein
VKVATAAIMNFNHPWMKKTGAYATQDSSEEVKPVKVDTTNIGTYEEDTFTLTDNEILYVSKHYLLM